MPEHHPDKRKCSGRERLISVAQALAEKRPFDDITIDEIITAAELSRPAFYYHFTGGKDELRAELVHRGFLHETPTHDTRQAILEAALRVFARSGIYAATLEDIAAEAGVTRGALLWHFHSKDELLSAIIKDCGFHSFLRPAIDQIEQELQSGVPLDDETIFRRLATAFYDGFMAQSDFTRLAILLLYTRPEAAHLLSEKIAKGRKTMNEFIKKRQAEGRFCKNLDPALLIQIMAATFIMRAIGRASDLLPLAHLSREQIIDQLVSLLLYGIVERDQSQKK